MQSPILRLSGKNFIRVFCIFFAMGVYTGYYFQNIAVLALLCVSIVLIIVLIWKSRFFFLLCLLGATALIGGAIRMQLSLHIVDERGIDFFNGSFVQINTVVTEPPDIRPDKAYLTVTTKNLIAWSQKAPEVGENLSESKDQREIGGKILITTSPQTKVAYGDRMEITGKLETPKESGEFSYKSYLAKDDIFSTMNKPKISILAHEQGNPVYAVLFSIRKKLEEQINLVFPEPYSSLMSGLLLGIKKTIPPDFLDDLKRTGLTHIIALSGFNITIIISFIAGFLLKNFEKKLRFGIAIAFVVLFTLMVGAAASILRAAIMGIIAIIATAQGRQSDGLNLLLMALFVMILLHPLAMLLDIGFQLSFLATLGLILLTKPVEKKVRWLPSRFGIKETLVTTLSAQIMVLPILLTNFEQLSLISPVSNLLILWILPLSMLFGTLAVVISFIPFVFLLAKLAGAAGLACLWYITNIVHLLAGLPFAAVEVQWWSISFSLLFYLLLGIALYHEHIRDQRQPKSTYSEKPL